MWMELIYRKSIESHSLALFQSLINQEITQTQNDECIVALILALNAI